MKTTLPIASALALCVGTAAADVVAGWNVRAGQANAVGAWRGPSGAHDFQVRLAMTKPCNRTSAGRQPAAS